MKLYTWLCFLFFIQISIWSQEKEKTLEVTYVKAYKNYKDSTNGAPKTMKNLEYILICTKNEARFEFIPNMEIDGENANRRFKSRGGGMVFITKIMKRNLSYISLILHLTTKSTLLKFLLMNING